MWLGHNSGLFLFRVPDYYEAKETGFKEANDGQNGTVWGISAGLPTWTLRSTSNPW